MASRWLSKYLKMAAKPPKMALTAKSASSNHQQKQWKLIMLSFSNFWLLILALASLLGPKMALRQPQSSRCLPNLAQHCLPSLQDGPAFQAHKMAFRTFKMAAKPPKDGYNTATQQRGGGGDRRRRRQLNPPPPLAGVQGV